MLSTMFKAASIVVALISNLAASMPLEATMMYKEVPQLDRAGFINPQITYSQGGHAVCVSGIVQVAATTDANVQLNIPSNLTTDEATQLVLNLNTANSSKYIDATTGEQFTAGGTWNISSRLCFPTNGTSVDTTTSSSVQLLTHGVAFNQIYWDFPNPNSSSSSNESQNGVGWYSYIDFAARQGKITFSYDRLGIENSSRPDPIQIVQGPLELEILHTLIGMLRTGRVGNLTFSTVVGVGHSYGSALTAAVARKYPEDFDAIVLTGFSANITGSAPFTSALNLLPSATFDPGFAGLPAGYLIPSTQYGVQYSFFAYPDFIASVLSEAFKTIATTTVGEQLTMTLVGGIATNYTRPVYVLDGERDLFFCDGDCNVVNTNGQNIPAATVTNLFPAADVAKSAVYVLDGSGHGVNLASNANMAFAEIQEWIAGL